MGMQRTNPAQIALLDLPPAPAPAREERARRARASMTAVHARALLAELDRVAAAEAKAHELMALVEAVGRAHGPDGSRRRAG